MAITMSSGGFNEACFSVENDETGEIEANSNRFGRLEEPGNSGEYLTRLDFDLACCSEKLPSLNVLLMHVASRESEFEAASEKDHYLADFAQRAVEFDLLSGILVSEVREMDNFMNLNRNKMNNIRKDIYLGKFSEEISSEMEDKLFDCEKSLKQSQDHISEIRKQSATFQTTLSRFYNGDGNVDKGATISIESSLSNANSTKIEMETAERQRDILRLLEKTTGREMDLENQLAESKRIEEDLNRRLKSSEQDLYLLEKKLRECDIQLQKTAASSEDGREKQALLNSTITDMENLIRNLELKVSKEGNRADTAEERFLVSSETHVQLNKDISFLRGRLNCLEASLQEAEESKMATSKAIDFQAKIILDLVTSLAVERERLHKQISSLALENKLLVVKLQRAKEKGKNGTEPSITDSEEEGIRKTKSLSESETVRRIDAGVLSLKHAILALLILMLSVGISYYFDEMSRITKSTHC